MRHQRQALRSRETAQSVCIARTQYLRLLTTLCNTLHSASSGKKITVCNLTLWTWWMAEKGNPAFWFVHISQTDDCWYKQKTISSCQYLEHGSYQGSIKEGKEENNKKQRITFLKHTHTHTHSKNVLGCPGLIIGFQYILLLKSILGWLGKKKDLLGISFISREITSRFTSWKKQTVFYICQRQRKYLPFSHNSFQKINIFTEFKKDRKKPLEQNKYFCFLIFNDQKQSNAVKWLSWLSHCSI